KQTADDPARLASIAFDQFLFDAHPYGARIAGSVKDVTNLRRRNIIRHYLQYYRPNNARLAVIGRYDAKSMQQSIEAAFSGWEARTQEAHPVPPPPRVEGRSFLVVDKSDLKQTQIRMGHVGVERTHKDYLGL